METKKWYASKTVWFNVVMTVIEIASYTETFLPANLLPWSIATQGVGTIILRIWFTNTTITS